MSAAFGLARIAGGGDFISSARGLPDLRRYELEGYRKVWVEDLFLTPEFFLVHKEQLT